MTVRGTILRLWMGVLLLLVMIGTLPSVAQQPIYNEQLQLTGEWISDHQVRLEWDRPRYPVLLQRKAEGERFFRTIGNPDKEVEFIDSNLKVNTSYTYRLRPNPAYYLDEYGAPLSMLYPVSPPDSVRVERTGIDGITVTAPTDTIDWPGEISVELRVEGVFEEVGRLNDVDTSMVIEDLETWRIQLVRLLYITDQNESEPTHPDTTYLPFPEPRPPRANVLDDHSIELYWEFPTHWHDHGFEVQKLEGTDTTSYFVAEGDTAWIDENVDFDRRTFYRVRGVSGDNVGEFSNMISARLQMNTVEGLQVDNIEDLTVQLTWTEPGPVSTNYFIQRSINGGPFETVAELPATARTYTDTLPERGLDVSYRVVSTNSKGDRIISDAVNQKVRDVAWGMVMLPNGPGGQPWYIDADEVSAGEFARFCAETEREVPPLPEHISGSYWYPQNNQPATMVSWDDAVAYCNWRSRSLGLEPAYDENGVIVNEMGGFRLPDSSIYNASIRVLGGGLNQAALHANLLGNDDGFRWYSAGLGPDAINPQAPVHLIGNVSEWVQDTIPNEGRMALGGAFSTPQDIVRRVPISRHPRDWRSNSIGFRCILPATQMASTP